MSNLPSAPDCSRSAKKRRVVRAFPLTVLGLVMFAGLLIVVGYLQSGTRLARIAERQGTIQEIHDLRSALDQFQIDNGRYPTTAEGLNALVVCPAGLSASWSQYIDAVPTDKWGHAFGYTCPVAGDGGSFEIISAGLDGVLGTADDIDQKTVR